MTPDQMTADQRALIEALHANPFTNIRAVHFDGELLMELVQMQRELDRKKAQG